MLAPTVIVTGICVPLALYYSNAYIMSAALMNLGLSGVDWSSAIKLLGLLKGRRLYFDGVTAYIPVET
jgi:hypothetical protein